ncbi:MAG: ATP-dependent Clp protease proteolytic subunit [Tepidisphaeraceae bacterium]
MRSALTTLMLALVVILGAALPGRGQSTTSSTTTSSVAVETRGRKAAVVQLHGEIDEYTSKMFIERIERAKADGARTIILALDTPGGLVVAAEDITRYLRSLDNDIHTVAFVERWAISAGIMIGLAADELVMAPQSKIGDSAPIAMSPDGGLMKLEGAERAKAESPVLADFYASSIQNGYDPLLTSAMVTVGRVVHFVQSPSGEKKFVEPEEYRKLIADGWKPVAGVPDPVDKADTLLTVDFDVAKKLGLSKGTFASPNAFAAERGLDIINIYAPTGGEQFIGWLGSGVVRGILIVILLQGLYFAFGHPGHGWPEAIALIALGLLLGVPLLTGYANWLEVVAILLGLVLLAIEIFVIPGFGFAGITGLILVFGGLVLTFVGGEPSMPGVLPSLRGTWIALQRGLFFVTAALACSMVLWIWLNRYLPRLPYFNKLILTTTAGDLSTIDADRPFETGPAVGDAGIAVTELKPGGSVKFMTDSYPDGRIAAVVSESGFVAPGTKVVATEVAGNRVVVRIQA